MAATVDHVACRAPLELGTQVTCFVKQDFRSRTASAPAKGRGSEFIIVPAAASWRP